MGGGGGGRRKYLQSSSLVEGCVGVFFFVVGGEGRRGRHVFRICLEVGIL